MSIGLPGTGVGAAFYLLSALWAPVRTLLGRGDRRSRGFGIALVAVGIIAALSLATIALSLALPEARVQVITLEPDTEGSGLTTTLLLVALLSPFGTLALIMLVVRVGAAILTRRARSIAAPVVDDALVGLGDESLEVAS